jgi:protein SCO1/2
VVTPLRSILTLALLCPALVVAGCRQAAPAAANGPVRHYAVTGKVVGTNAASDEVELDAAAIPGFMDAMTMPYKLKTPADLKKIHRGDRITGVLETGGSGTTLEDVKVTDTSKEVRELSPQILARPLVPGESVPDFALTDQSSRTIHLSDFHGKLLLVTFVYTNCPLSDYCPRMSHNFADIDKALAGTPAFYDRTHLLSVSFDPKRDTPAALRSYGGAYTGKYTGETFAHWSFAVPKPADLDPLLQFFDVGAVPAPGGTLTHTLSTVEIGPDGRVLKWYGGNDWTPAQVLADVHKSLGSGNSSGNSSGDSSGSTGA